MTSLPQPSFNDQADVDVLKINTGLAGRAASEVAQPRNTLWTPAY